MWKINNNFLKFMICYFLMFGASTLLLVIFSAVFEKFPFENFIRALSIGFIPPAIMNTFWWKKGMDKVELWVKRIYYCIITTVFNAVCLTAFNLKMGWKFFAVTFAAMFIMMLITIIPIWIIADRREKKKLEEINQKLQENQNA